MKMWAELLEACSCSMQREALGIFPIIMVRGLGLSSRRCTEISSNFLSLLIPT